MKYSGFCFGFGSQWAKPYPTTCPRSDSGMTAADLIQSYSLGFNQPKIRIKISKPDLN